MDQMARISQAAFVQIAILSRLEELLGMVEVMQFLRGLTCHRNAMQLFTLVGNLFCADQGHPSVLDQQILMSFSQAGLFSLLIACCI